MVENMVLADAGLNGSTAVKSPARLHAIHVCSVLAGVQ